MLENNMLTEVNTTSWVVRVHGQAVSANLPSQRLAEHALLQLPADQRAIAEIVPVTADGKMVLMG